MELEGFSGLLGKWKEPYPMRTALELWKGGSPTGTQDTVTERRQKGHWTAILARVHYVATSEKLA